MSAPPTPAASALDVRSLPLSGTRLIEASAGTGKTWTIASLVLRLVLGHAPAGERAIAARSPDEILVTTFTIAATQELSDRIRQRLLEGARVLDDEPGADPDDFLRQLRADYEDPAARRQAVWRLRMAAAAMDDAAVLTLDAFCQQALREHAFDSVSRLDQTIALDSDAERLQWASDYWREQVYPMSSDSHAAVAGVWGQPSRLGQELKDLRDARPGAADRWRRGRYATWLFDEPDRDGARLRPLEQVVQPLLDARRALHALPWEAHVQEIERAVEGRKIAQRQHIPGWLSALRRWAEGGAEILALDLPLKEAMGRRLAGDVLRSQGVQTGPAFDALDALFAQWDAVSTRELLRAHAAAWLAARHAERQAREARFAFDDLTWRLAEALDPSHGERALRLRQRIVERYPVAMVDEFQDTSAAQWLIFERLYGVGDAPGSMAPEAPEQDPSADPVLLLIGDPKQSIYRFRGADIASYLRAGDATRGRHHTLGINHRSTHALVDGLNRLYEAADVRDEAGAFAVGRERLPFVAVGAKGREEMLVGGDVDAPGSQQVPGKAAPVPAITFAIGPAAQEDAARERARRCADAIARWLDDPQRGFVERGDDGTAAGASLRRLDAGDIAVLVPTHAVAAAMRRALNTLGVPCVVVSERDSVYASGEAEDLLRLLQAVAEPRALRGVRALMGSALASLSLQELRAAADDDAQIDVWTARLQHLQRVQERSGVLAMIRQAIHEFGWAARWMRDPERGERRMTNVMHLSELLQGASLTAEGSDALMRWLAAQIRSVGQNDSSGSGLLNEVDPQILRLESDARRVRIVTVHQSKGLQYPVVFLPDGRLASGGGGAARESVAQVTDPNEPSGRRLELRLSAEDAAICAQEEQAEDRRKLYVALTRAQHAVWIGLMADEVDEADAVDAVDAVDAGDARPAGEGEDSALQEQAPAQGKRKTSSKGKTAKGKDETARKPSAIEALLGTAVGQETRTARAWMDALRRHLDALGPAAAGTVAAGQAPEPRYAVTRATSERFVQPSRSRVTVARAAAPAPLAPARRFAARIERDWTIGSYTALMRRRADEPLQAGFAGSGAVGQDVPVQGAPALRNAVPAAGRADAPSGPEQGEGLALQSREDAAIALWPEDRILELRAEGLVEQWEESVEPAGVEYDDFGPTSLDGGGGEALSAWDLDVAPQAAASGALLPPSQVSESTRKRTPLRPSPQLDLPFEATADSTPAPWHRVAGGVRTGTLVHEMLERIAPQHFSLSASMRAQITREARTRLSMQWLDDRGDRRWTGESLDEWEVSVDPDAAGWTAGARRPPVVARPIDAATAEQAGDALGQWIDTITTTRCIGSSCRSLRDLPRTVAEMEFWLPADALNAQDVDRACSRHLLPGRPRPALPPRVLSGMLMGFIDLAFDDGARWGLLDYKTNRLGANAASYGPEAVAAAALASRYDVQLAIYQLALMRQLRARRGPVFDPARDLGPALVWFLRGLDAPGHGIVDLTAPLELLMQLDGWLGEPQAGDPS